VISGSQTGFETLFAQRFGDRRFARPDRVLLDQIPLQVEHKRGVGLQARRRAAREPGDQQHHRDRQEQHVENETPAEIQQSPQAHEEPAQEPGTLRHVHSRNSNR
jgi:hypothetical protein